MYFKTFYRIALLLPILMPLILMLVGKGSVAAALIISFWTMGVEYILFTVFSFFYIGYLDSAESVRKFIWMTPLLFVVISIIGWYLHQFWNKRSNPDLIISVDAIFPIIIFGLVVGYGYWLIAEIFYRILKGWGLISFNLT